MQSQRLSHRLTTCLLVSGLACCADRASETRVSPAASPPPGAAPRQAGATLFELPPGQEGRFAPRASYGQRELVLNGSGLCEWGFFGIDLYRAALFVERPLESAAEGLLAQQVLVFQLEFVRELSAKQLREAYSASVRVNAGSDAARYEEPLAALLSSLREVRAGEAYTFVCDPARGLLVQRDGQLVATIEDDSFRRLFVRLYLGQSPPTRALRRGLLGQASE